MNHPVTAKEQDNRRSGARDRSPQHTNDNHNGKDDSFTAHDSHASAGVATNKSRESTAPTVEDQVASHNIQGAYARKAATKRKQNNLRLDVLHGISQDIDSEIEDVTDQYVEKKQIRPSPPEIIEVEDVSSDEESCSGLKMRSSDAGRVDKAHKEHGQEKDDTEDGRSSDGNDVSESDIEDVTEFMLEKRKEELLEVMSRAIDVVDLDDEYAVDHGGPFEVLIGEEDIPTCPGKNCTTGREDESKYSGDENSPGENNVDQTIKQRIIELLNTGFHPKFKQKFEEMEAENAMKLARRLMERYNLDQSVFLQERGDKSLNDFSTTNDESNCPSALRGGIVNVSIRNRKKGTALTSLSPWMEFLVHPICSNFHVDAFKSISRATKYKEGECTISFYGIKTNAQLAAYAYKISIQRISVKTRAVKKPRLRDALRIANWLDFKVKAGLRKEEERRKSKLNKARRAAKSYEDSDDNEESSAEDESDSNKSIHLTLEQLERENTVQLALIDHRKRIAEDILKYVEVRAGRKCESVSCEYPCI
ncbi:hypothetical protein HJC23_011155 [Cyclotella cryptica]|uniref:Uncharacterized protein n=1 Tax=Cyclotella cryptica TaxID=29204 RepID=A0ABD3NW45_9STRA|eukprot:CCRYP_019611-RA/>CCRYP_019611-RA protein AED:0.22 eAED:0.22 QI:102/1/1/1/0.33/0.25/4/1636/534